MAISFRPNLIKPQALFSYLPHTNRNVKFLAQMLPKLPSQIFRPGRENIDILCSTRFADIRIHGLCTEQNGIVPPLQKLEHSLLNFR